MNLHIHRHICVDSYIVKVKNGFPSLKTHAQITYLPYPLSSQTFSQPPNYLSQVPSLKKTSLIIIKFFPVLQETCMWTLGGFNYWKIFSKEKQQLNLWSPPPAAQLKPAFFEKQRHPAPHCRQRHWVGSPWIVRVDGRWMGKIRVDIFAQKKTVNC